MSKGSNRKEYLLIFLVLGILTGLEIWVAGALSGNLKVWTLITLAFTKALCVAAFYMHLKAERNWLRVIAGFPIAVGLYTLVLVKEVMFR